MGSGRAVVRAVETVGKDLSRSGGAASFSGAFGDHDVVLSESYRYRRVWIASICVASLDAALGRRVFDLAETYRK